MIAFHDTVAVQSVAEDNSSTRGIYQFWRELAEEYPERTRNILTAPGPWGHYGIGVFTLPDDNMYLR